MPELPIYEKHGHMFRPMNPPAVKFLEKTKPFDLVVLQSRQQRNLGFHRKAFALLNVVFDAQEKYDTPEQLRLAMTVHAGYVQQIEVNETTVLIPESWAFDNKEMTPERFDALFSSMIDFGVGLSGISEAKLREIVGFV